MSFSSLLIHEAEIYRRSGQTDRFGQPTDVNPTIRGPLTTTFPCRLSGSKGGLKNEERTIDVFEVTYTIFTELEADVQEDDTIVVRDPRTGFELMPPAKIRLKAYISDSVGVHHAELEAVVQRGPQ